MAMRASTRGLVVATILGAAVASNCSGAAAQSGTFQPGDEMKTLSASPTDIAEGRRLAELYCEDCHGADGVSKMPEVPHLAGQRPAYLYLELKGYQAGNRGNNNPMNDVVKFLSDDALTKVAAYFASLDPAPSPAVPPGPGKPDAVQAGKTVAMAACAGCHGNTGVSQIPATPSLAGLDPKYMAEAMKAYKNGQRKNDTMKAMLASVSERAVTNIALFYGLQAPAITKTAAAGDVEAGKEASANCVGCHGEKGVSGNPATPSLAGQDPQYLVAALQAYKGGSRSDETMKALAASLDDKAMKNLAAYFAAQTPKAPNVRKPLTTEEWTERCDRCHGVNGNSTDPRLPMLAGQRADYLSKALQGYRERTRKSSEMAAMAGGLNEDDVDNLAYFYEHRKARAILFVPLPAK